MNIFENYLKKIIQTLKETGDKSNISLPQNLSGINVDIPPKQFKADISTKRCSGSGYQVF